MKDITIVLEVILEIIKLLKKAFEGDKPATEALLKLISNEELKTEFVRRTTWERAKRKFIDPA